MKHNLISFVDTAPHAHNIRLKEIFEKGELSLIQTVVHTSASLRARLIFLFKNFFNPFFVSGYVKRLPDMTEKNNSKD
jgi:hypothetical protein